MNSKATGWGKRAQIGCAHLILLLLGAVSPLVAQLRSLDVSQYIHASWTAREGFFTGGVQSIAQTPDGYLWLTSSSGLLRFDGVRFVQWVPPGSDTIPGSPLNRLFVTRNGSLWITGKGIAELSTDGTFRRFHEFDGSALGSQIAEDADGGLWLGLTPSPGGPTLCRIYKGRSRCIGQHGLFGSWVGPLYADKENRVWASTQNGIWTVWPGTPQKISASSTMSRFFFENGSDGLLFADASTMRLVSLDGSIQDYKGYPSQIDGKPFMPTCVLKDRNGSLWIGTDGQGIVHIHDGNVDHFSLSDGLSSNNVPAIFQDREGTVWALTRDGLDRFTKPAVPKLTDKQGISNGNILSVLTDRNGVSWIGTPGGLNKLEGGHLSSPSVSLPSTVVTSLFENAAGRLLVSTASENGMVWLDGKKSVPLAAQSGSNIYDIAEDRHGDLWVVSRESGLLHLKSNGDLIRAYHQNELGIPISLLASDPARDGLWLGTRFGDLGFFKDGKLVRWFGANKELGDGILRDPQVDSKGAVWVGTRIGLGRLMDGRVSILGRKNGLPCDAVLWMRHGADHNVWLFTECGLLSFSEADLASWSADPSYRVRITHHLDNTNGVSLVSVNQWYTPQVTTTHDGLILFASLTGLSFFDPRDLNQNTLPPPVHIEEVTADGRSVISRSGTELPANTRVVHIAYTALSFAEPRKVQFRYRLQGFDKMWSSPVSLREVAYTNLPPGKYQFQVIACNNDEIWNDGGAMISFRIAPAWYQTVWFRFLAVLVAICILTVFYLTRVRRIEREMKLRLNERMAERMRIAREIHDTLLQSLQGLVLSFSSFSAQVTTTAEMRYDMERSLEHAEQLVISGRERIRDLRGEPTGPDDLMGVLSAALDEAFEDSASPPAVQVDGIPRPLRAAVQDETIWIVREALANTIRHSGADTVQLSISFRESAFRISVEDHGSGFDPRSAATARDRHFGLLGMQERATRIAGQLSIDSSPGKGTTIVLSVPNRHAYEDQPNWIWSSLSTLRGIFRRTQGNQAKTDQTTV